MNSIRYETVDHVEVSELRDFYASQEHQTSASPEKLERMVANSFCFVTAREQGRLVGIARAVTDGVSGHLVDCKLDPAHQGPGAVTRTDGRIEHDREGIAREMAVRVIDALRDYGVEEIHALAYGTEVDFCEELGFRKVAGMVALRLNAQANVSVAAPSMA